MRRAAVDFHLLFIRAGTGSGLRQRLKIRQQIKNGLLTGLQLSQRGWHSCPVTPYRPWPGGVSLMSGDQVQVKLTDYISQSANIYFISFFNIFM